MAIAVLKNFLNLLYKYRYIIILFWGIIFFFLLLDGLDRYSYQLDWQIILKAVDHRKWFLFVPIAFLLIYLYLKKKILLKKSSCVFLVIAYCIFSTLSELIVNNILNPYAFDIIFSLIRGILIIFAIFYVLFWYEHIQKNEENIFAAIKGFKFDKSEIFFFSIILLIALIARFINIDGLYPATDEYTHLVKAQTILNPNSLIAGDDNIINYERADFVSYLVLDSFKIFGVGVLQGRLPGVIVSVLTVGLLYLILRNENKTLALVASLDIALSPWLLMQSRIAREYIFFLPLYIALAFYIYQRINTILERKYRWYHGLMDVSITLGIVYYCFFIDGMSTFKLVFLFYPVAIIYYFLRLCIKQGTKLNFFIKSIRNKILIIVITAIIFCTLLVLGKIFNTSIFYNQINILPKAHFEAIETLVFNEAKSSFIFGELIVCLGLFYLIKQAIRKRATRLETFTLISFGALIYFFVFHFNGYVNTRYLFVTLPSLILIESYAVILIFNFIKEFFPKNDVLKRLISYFLLFNWFFIGLAILSKGGGVFLATGNYHNTMPEINAYLKDKVDDDVLISSLSLGNEWYFDKGKGIKDIYYYNYKNQNRMKEISDIMKHNFKGYFIIDEYINDLTEGGFILGQDIPVEDRSLHFIYTNGSNYVYEWGHLNAN